MAIYCRIDEIQNLYVFSKPIDTVRKTLERFVGMFREKGIWAREDIYDAGNELICSPTLVQHIYSLILSAYGAGNEQSTAHMDYDYRTLRFPSMAAHPNDVEGFVGAGLASTGTAVNILLNSTPFERYLHSHYVGIIVEPPLCGSSSHLGSVRASALKDSKLFSWLREQKLEKYSQIRTAVAREMGDSVCSEQELIQELGMLTHEYSPALVNTLKNFKGEKEDLPAALLGAKKPGTFCASYTWELSCVPVAGLETESGTQEGYRALTESGKSNVIVLKKYSPNMPVPAKFYDETSGAFLMAGSIRNQCD
ncbi:MAG: hypothetical protein KJ955_00635 [Nanoarchaeota archaeon]|nr:hypothetical protein [Nanoarchaeota archaeon]